MKLFYIPCMLFIATQSIYSMDMENILYARPAAQTVVRLASERSERNEQGQTLIHQAVKARQKRMVSYLVAQSGLDINAVDNQELTPLDHAAQAKDTDMVSFLLSLNATLTDAIFYRALNTTSPEVFDILMQKYKPNQPVLHHLATSNNVTILIDYLEVLGIEVKPVLCAYCRNLENAPVLELIVQLHVVIVKERDGVEILEYPLCRRFGKYAHVELVVGAPPAEGQPQ